MPTTGATDHPTTVPATTTTPADHHHDHHHHHDLVHHHESSSTTSTTLAPLIATNTSSKTPWALIVVIVVLVLAIGLIILLLAARRRGSEAAWRKAVVPALSDAQLARASLLSDNAVSDDAEVRGAVAVQVERAVVALDHTVASAPDPEAGQWPPRRPVRCGGGLRHRGRPPAPARDGGAHRACSWPRPTRPVGPGAPS